MGFHGRSKRAFHGKTIYYRCATIEDTTEINTKLSNVNNDIQEIVSRRNKVSDEGFCFVHATLYNSEYYLNYGFTLDQSQLLPNYFLSLPSLIARFHYHQRPFLNGEIDNSPVTFVSAIRRRNQPSVIFPIDEVEFLNNYNPADQQRTGLEWGEVTESKYSFRAGTLNVSTVHS